MDFTAIAKRAYHSYGKVTDFKNYQGNPMPEWEALSETIQAAWVAASRSVYEDVTNSKPAQEKKR